MKFYVFRLRVPARVVKHLPRDWVRYSFSLREIDDINRRAKVLAAELEDKWE